MIRKLLAAHRNLFLEAERTKYNNITFPIVTINDKYGFIRGKRPNEIFPTIYNIKQYLMLHDQLPDFRSNLIALNVCQIMILLFKKAFIELKFSQKVISSYFGVSQTWISRILLNIDTYKIPENFNFCHWETYFKSTFMNSKSDLLINDDNIIYQNLRLFSNKRKSSIPSKRNIYWPLSNQPKTINNLDDFSKSKNMEDSTIFNNIITSNNESEWISILKDIRYSQQIMMTTLLEINRKLK